MKVKKHKIQFFEKQYQVLVPEYHFRELYVCETHKNSGIIYGNKEDLIKLGEYIKYLYYSSEFILYIPCKKKATEYLQQYWGKESSCDLVIGHHSIQLNYKDWKVLRSRLKEYDVIEMDIEVDECTSNEFEEFHYKDNKDILKSVIRYDTLFLTSSKVVFKHIIYDCFDLAENGEELFHRIRGVHDHKHLDCYMSYKDKYHKCIDVTLDYYDKVLWQH